MGISNHLTVLLRNLYASQEETELDMEQRTGSKLRKECQGCILSLCSFNLYAEHIMWNARVDEAQAGVKISGEISITADMQITQP